MTSPPTPLTTPPSPPPNPTPHAQEADVAKRKADLEAAASGPAGPEGPPGGQAPGGCGGWGPGHGEPLPTPQEVEEWDEMFSSF